MHNEKKEKRLSGKIVWMVLLHILLLMYSFSDIASKLAAGQEFLSPKFILLYGAVIVILFVYAVFWQQILKKIPLITAYANKSVTIIWGMFFGAVLFQEEITWNKILGAVIIIIGVYFVVSEDAKE